MQIFHKSQIWQTLTKAFVGLGIVGGISVVNAEAKESQVVVKSGELGGFENNDKIFSGKVKVTYLFNDAEYRPFGGGLVEFSKGARSAWHTHPSGQTLIVVDGEIYTGTETGVVQIARKGDTILCPPNLKHWHGAGLKQSGSHIALTGVKDGKNVVWLEKLSDKEYQEAIKKAK